MSWRAFACSVVLALRLREGAHSRSMADSDLATVVSSGLRGGPTTDQATSIAVRIVRHDRGVDQISPYVFG